MRKVESEKTKLECGQVGRTECELQSLRQEFEIQKNLRHPNIVHVLGAFETRRELVVVGEFVDGDLHGLLDASRVLSEDRMRQARPPPLLDSGFHSLTGFGPYAGLQ